MGEKRTWCVYVKLERKKKKQNYSDFDILWGVIIEIESKDLIFGF